MIGSDVRKEGSLMFRKWMQVVGLSLVVISLSGCGKSIEAQIDSGLNLTQTVFAKEPKEVTETVGDIQLYLPIGFDVEKNENDVNLLISKGTDSYILFINENEGSDSQLHYDLLKQDTSKDIIEEKTFEEDDIFGFSAVIKDYEDAYELVVSLGGVKMTTISTEKDIEDNLANMLKIVRSVELKDKK